MALTVINSSSQVPHYIVRVNTNPSSPLQDSSAGSYSRSNSLHIATETAEDALISHHSSLRPARTDPRIDYGPIDCSSIEGDETWRTLDNIAAIGLTLEKDGDDLSQSIELSGVLPGSADQDVDEDELELDTVRPFHKWMKNLQRRAHRQSTHDGEDWVVEPFPEFTHRSGSHHRNSSSGSSFDFVAAVKSASVSLASASMMTRRRHQTGRSSTYARTDRSSRASISAPRFSEDSAWFEGSLEIDPAVDERLLQRRRILEELINTEESYIGDVKFLMNVRILSHINHPTLLTTDDRSMSPY